jgi:D-amino peptidase
MEAAIAGDFGVSLWLVTGDSAGMAEAEQIIKGVKTVSVKEAMGEFEALCYGPKVTARSIFDAAKDVMVNNPMVSPLIFKSPVTIEIDLANSDYTDKLKKFYPELFATDNTVKLIDLTVTKAWSKYLVIQKEVKSK